MSVSPTERAHQLREYGIQTSLLLRDHFALAPPEQQDEIIALSARLHYCNQTRNTWLGSDLHSSETGELFEGFGRYWQCGSKLCSYCLRLNARRNRHTLRRAIESQKLLVGQHYRFITLTVPNNGLPISTVRTIVNRAWELLRKRKFFVGCVVGGAKAEEFTLTRSGFHYHLHLLARSKQMHAQKLRAEWTDCVEQACKDFAQPFQVNTSDGYLLANIKIVHDLKQVTNEVCKYITKVSSFWKMPPEKLIEIALIPRWHRMFEVFGSFRKVDTEKLDKELSDAADQYPQKKLYEDNDQPHERRNTWRWLIKQMPLKKYLKRLEAEFENTIELRSKVLQLKFPFATITTLDST